MARLCYYVFLFLLVPNIAFSQGRYIEKGQNGFGISGGFSSNKDAKGFGGNIGYSISGILDLGFSYSRSTTNDEPKIYSDDISPSINIHILKQSINVPISFSMGAKYIKSYYSGDFLDDYDLELNSSGFVIGGEIAGKIPIDKDFAVMPSFGISYYSYSAEIKDQYGNSAEDDDSVTDFIFELPLIFYVGSKNLFCISPGLSMDEDYNTFFVNLSFIVPSETDESQSNLL
ncbi:MAG: hypothetical protein GF317_15310 [Candidatus Lokiarchaeota archaeon]|nr:hypothetical protein [Candidatus Lokiarchaeota archaeon]